jgi:hypothetical protein
MELLLYGPGCTSISLVQHANGVSLHVYLLTRSDHKFSSTLIEGFLDDIMRAQVQRQKAYHEGADLGTTKQIISPAFSSFVSVRTDKNSAGRPGAPTQVRFKDHVVTRAK